MIDNKQNEPTTQTKQEDSALDESQPKDTGAPPSLVQSTNQKKNENFGLEILKIVLFAIIIVTPIRIFIAQPFVVSGASMDHSFANGQYLIVDQLSYRFDEPERGDVVIFRFPLEPSKFFIKRIIGLPEETVVLQGKKAIIINEENPEGLVLNETYLSPENVNASSLSTPLGEEEYFVMGDNRKESSDSRSWGPLGKEYIVGQAFLRLFPITKFDILPGQ